MTDKASAGRTSLTGQESSDSFGTLLVAEDCVAYATSNNTIHPRCTLNGSVRKLAEDQ